MKKFMLLCCFTFFFSTPILAAPVLISISGFSYNPANVTVNVGDVVTIEASSLHPLVQVTQATWNAGGNTALQGGFNATASYDVTITAAMAGTTIYFVCENHAVTGMKGQINVNVASGISENQAKDFNFTLYPNPVKTDAWINMSVKKAGKVSIVLFNMQGRVVKYLYNLNALPGELTLPFSAGFIQKGIYILQMRTSQGKMYKQIVLQ